jgi:hypothetical protein
MVFTRKEPGKVVYGTMVYLKLLGCNSVFKNNIYFMIKKYIQFIKEGDESTDISKSSNKYDEIKDEIKSMIENTIEKSGGEFSQFLESLIKNPEDVKVEGFINDSDIYDFYLKWRNDIDEVLSDIKYYNNSASDNNAFGLYEYVIKGTQKAFDELVKMLK